MSADDKFGTLADDAEDVPAPPPSKAGREAAVYIKDKRPNNAQGTSVPPTGGPQVPLDPVDPTENQGSGGQGSGNFGNQGGYGGNQGQGGYGNQGQGGYGGNQGQGGGYGNQGQGGYGGNQGQGGGYGNQGQGGYGGNQGQGGYGNQGQGGYGNQGQGGYGGNQGQGGYGNQGQGGYGNQGQGGYGGNQGGYGGNQGQGGYGGNQGQGGYGNQGGYGGNQSGGNPTEPNYSADQWQNIHYAARNGNSNPSNLRSQMSPSTIEARGTTTNYTPLHVAVKFDQSQGVRELLNQNGNVRANVNSQDILGQTPLALACCFDIGTDIPRQLLDAGAVTEIVDEYGWTPLFWAASKGFYPVAQLLVERRAKKDARDKQWRRPYDVAPRNNQQLLALLD